MKIINYLLLSLALFLVAQPTFAADCAKTGSICLDGPSTKVINGNQVYRDCWEYQDTYSCLGSSTLSSDCQALADKGCGQVGSKCIDTMPSGQCDVYQQTYSCKLSSGTTTTVTDCGGQTFCQGGDCFDSGSKPDTDFGSAVTGLEIQREYGKYMDPDGTIFKGIPDSCRKKLGSLINCCSTAGGSGANMTNKTALALNTASTVYNAIGSSYTYDSLFAGQSTSWIETGYNFLFGAGGNGYTSSVLAEYLTTDMTTAEFVSEMMPGPWTIAILIIMYSGILNCDDSEKVLGMKRDNNLCTFIGSYCSAKIPVINTCVQTTEAYCCYNSKLSRIINEQGRPQLGKSYGAPESPDCSGFTPDELQKLDFSKIDLSEFIKDITPQIPAQSDQSQVIQNKVNSYYAQ